MPLPSVDTTWHVIRICGEEAHQISTEYKSGHFGCEADSGWVGPAAQPAEFLGKTSGRQPPLESPEDEFGGGQVQHGAVGVVCGLHAPHKIAAIPIMLQGWPMRRLGLACTVPGFIGCEADLRDWWLDDIIPGRRHLLSLNQYLGASTSICAAFHTVTYLLWFSGASLVLHRLRFFLQIPYFTYQPTYTMEKREK